MQQVAAGFQSNIAVMAQVFQAGPDASLVSLMFLALYNCTPPGEKYIFGLGPVRQFRVGISCVDWHNTLLHLYP